MGMFGRIGQDQQQCPSQSRSSQHCAQSSALHSARLPSVANTDAHLADARGLSAEALKKELKNLKITKGTDGSTTLSFQVEANSYSLGYAFANGHSNGGPATVIHSRDRCGRMTTSRSTDLSGRYRVETTPQKDGSVAFTVKLDASLTRARLSLGNKSLVIDPNALKAGDTKASTPQKAPENTPSTRSYDPSYEDAVSSPSDRVVPDRDTNTDTTPAQGTTKDPRQRNTPPVIQKPAPAQTDLPADEMQTAGSSSTPAYDAQERDPQIVRPTFRDTLSSDQPEATNGREVEVDINPQQLTKDVTELVDALTVGSRQTYGANLFGSSSVPKLRDEDAAVEIISKYKNWGAFAQLNEEFTKQVDWDKYSVRSRDIEGLMLSHREQIKYHLNSSTEAVLAACVGGEEIVNAALETQKAQKDYWTASGQQGHLASLDKLDSDQLGRVERLFNRMNPNPDKDFRDVLAELATPGYMTGEDEDKTAYQRLMTKLGGSE